MTFTIPNIFVAGKKAVAYEVNENFNAVKEELNRQNDGIIENTTAIDEAKGYLEVELQEELTSISRASGGKFSVNSGNIDAQGNACLLSMPSLGSQWITWGQPVATSYVTQVPLPGGGTGSMVISSSVDSQGAAWKAMDGAASSSNNGWRAGTGASPQWWQVKFPYPIKILGLKHTNTNTNDSSSVTGRFYTGSNKAVPIGNTFTTPSNNAVVTAIANIPTEGVLTDTIYFERTAGGTYSGIGELTINAQWQITLSAATILPFNVGDKYPDLAITFSDGKQKIFESLVPIDITTFEFNGTPLSKLGNLSWTMLLSPDGTYRVGLGLYKQSIAPLNPSYGDVWIDASTTPAKAKYFGGLDGENSGKWVTIDNIALGRFTISGGVITSCTTLPYNSLKQTLSGQNKDYVASLALPSEKYTDFTLPSSGSVITAPANGYFAFGKTSNAANQYVSLTNQKNLMGSYSQASASGTANKVWLPCSKGDQILVEYNAGSITNFFRFIYAEGAK